MKSSDDGTAVRRRGGSLCIGYVTVTNADNEEVAITTVTYKLNP